jgi:single-stranded DNA-binding protein
VAGGTAFTSFSDAVNRSYYDRPRGERIAQLTIFHQVVAFGALAETTAATLKRGTTVTVSGQLAHDSYSPDGSDLDAIAAELNGRPRQALGFKTPSEALAEVSR